MNNTYNGWKNYETWNVALYINNDEFFYSIAKRCANYAAFCVYVMTQGFTHTPDGVSFGSFMIDEDRMNELITEIKG